MSLVLCQQLSQPRIHKTYLQEAVYYLLAHIFLIGSEEVALEHAKYTFGDAEIGLQVFGYALSTLGFGRGLQKRIHL